MIYFIVLYEKIVCFIDYGNPKLHTTTSDSGFIYFIILNKIYFLII